MPLTDLSLAECLAFRPELPAPDDLDDFWARTLAAAEAAATPARFEPVDTGLTQIRTFDVTASGFDGQPVRGWLHLPAGAKEPLGCVVEYLGYGRGRGLPHQSLFWSSAGYAHLIMDSRAQGWSTALGATPDPAEYRPGTVPGFLTRGVESPDSYYYRRLITDAVRFVAAARSHPGIDPARVVVTGISQGGGLSLAVAGLVPDLAGVMPDVPFLCNIRRGVEIAALPPYTEVSQYLALHRANPEQVFHTLSYVDAALLAARATAPSLFSIALMDRICPPSTCFTAFHAYGGPKEVRVYEFNDHEGGAEHQQLQQLAWLRAVIG